MLDRLRIIPLLLACFVVGGLALPAFASATPDLEVRLGAEGVQRNGERLTSSVGTSVTVFVTVVNAGTEPSAAGAQLTIDLPAGLRPVGQPTIPTDVACAPSTSAVIHLTCTVASLERAQSRQLVFPTQAWRTKAVTPTASVTSTGDANTVNDAASFPFDIGVQTTGRHCTILGSAGNEAIFGTPGDDVICGLAGADSITAGAGRDLVYGDAGDDRIALGAGDDSSLGGAGNDILRGGPGVDGLQGGAGRDELRGDAGPGVLRGDSGDDRLFGGTAVDALYGGTGNDTIRACDGIAEVVVGQAGQDRAILDAGDMPYALERIERCP